MFKDRVKSAFVGNISEATYDPWGKRSGMHLDTTTSGLGITDRGFTGHKHLEALNIIHMKGRIYDPTIGRSVQCRSDRFWILSSIRGLVLGDKIMKCLILFVFIFLSSNAVSESVAIENHQSVSNFLSVNSKWVAKSPDSFTPISSLQILDKAVWIKTYKADYFPVTLSIEEGEIYLDNLTFRKKLPVDKHDDPALFVDKYKS